MGRVGVVMEIPDDYKKTEVGVIPVDWESKELGEIGVVSSGGTPNRSNLSYWNGDIPWITTSQIDFNTITSSNEFITELGLKNSAAKMYLKNTLLMAMYGQGKTRGKVAVLGIKATINQACAAITLNRDISNNYVFFYLAHNYEEIRKLSNTGNQENLNGNLIKSICIPLPPLPEQKAIALSLSDTDALIAACDRAITKKRNIKQGEMQQLLTGKMRLPGFSGEWEVKKLGEITIKVGSGITPTGGAKVYKKEGRPFLRSQNVGWGKLLLEDIVYINDAIHETFQETEIKNKDVFLNITGASIGRSAIADTRVEHGNVNQHVCIIRLVENEAEPFFLNYFLLSTDGQKQIDSFQAGGNRQGINFGQIKSFSLFIPPLPEQKAISQILSDMDAEIAALEKKRDKYKAIKQGMMQELLTGKTRLKDDVDK